MVLSLIKRHIATFRQKLFKDLAWNAFGALSLQGSNLIVAMILVNILGISEFGAYQLIILTLFMVGNIAQGGCAFVATKVIAENLGKNVGKIASFLKMFSRITWIFGIFVAIILTLFAPLICNKILLKPELLEEFYIAVVTVSFQVGFTYRTGALQGFAAFRQIGQMSAWLGMLTVLIMFVGAKFGGLEGALAGHASANAIRLIACIVSLRNVRISHDIPSDGVIDRQSYRDLWDLALPAGLAGMVTLPALWVVNVAVSQFSDGLVLVGILAIAHQIRQTALYFPILLTNVSFSVTSRMLGKGTQNEAKAVYRASIFANVAFAVSMAAFVLLFAEEVLSLWNISSPLGAQTLRLLALSLIPELAATSVYQIVQSSGLMWRSLFQIVLPRDLVLALLSLTLLPKYGLPAAAAGYLVAHMIGFALTLWTARQVSQLVYVDNR